MVNVLIDKYSPTMFCPVMRETIQNSSGKYVMPVKHEIKEPRIDSTIRRSASLAGNTNFQINYLYEQYLTRVEYG